MDANHTQDIQNLSEADKIFIPADIDGDKTDYFDYKIKMFRTVPENCFVVKQNIFTGKRVLGGGRGLKAILPFYKSILVPSIDRLIDYQKIEYLTADGANVNVDLDVTVRITDPVKYENEGKHQLSSLSSLIYSLLGNYIGSLRFMDIKKGVLSREKFSPTKYNTQSGKPLMNELDQFEEEYGISIGKLFLKDVRLPKDLEKVYNDTLEAQQKRDAQRVRLEAQKEEAEMKARIVGIQTDAEVKKYQKLEEEKNKIHMDRMNKEIVELKSQGFSSKEITDILKIRYASEGKNSHVIVGTNQQSGDIAMGVLAAGNHNSEKDMDEQVEGMGSEYQSVEPNSVRFLNHIKLCEVANTILPGTYENMVGFLNNPEFVKKLDSCSEKDYELFLQNVLAANKISSEEVSKRRGR